MLAEKAALLGRELNDEDEPTTPPVIAKSSSPVTEGLTTAQPLTTPGETTTDPLANRNVAAETRGEGPKQMSEKARGKMRATDSVDLSSPTTDTPGVPDEELIAVASAGVGPNGYVPTQEWVSSWQKG
jgi:hypothetical protein